jgi:hypothetical protein
MLNHNATCVVRKLLGFDVVGKPRLGEAVTERCAVLRLRREVQHTTVRADGSQSRGHGDEFVASHKIHLDGNTVAGLGDQVTVAGVVIRVTGMNPCFDVAGPLDHYEIGGAVWA